MVKWVNFHKYRHCTSWNCYNTLVMVTDQAIFKKSTPLRQTDFWWGERKSPSHKPWLFRNRPRSGVGESSTVRYWVSRRADLTSVTGHWGWTSRPRTFYDGQASFFNNDDDRHWFSCEIKNFVDPRLTEGLFRSQGWVHSFGRDHPRYVFLCPVPRRKKWSTLEVPKVEGKEPRSFTSLHPSVILVTDRMTQSTLDLQGISGESSSGSPVSFSTPHSTRRGRGPG